MRESRRICGEHMLSMEDLKNGTVFEDAICVVGSAIRVMPSCFAMGEAAGTAAAMAARTGKRE